MNDNLIIVIVLSFCLILPTVFWITLCTLCTLKGKNQHQKTLNEDIDVAIKEIKNMHSQLNNFEKQKSHIQNEIEKAKKEIEQLNQQLKEIKNYDKTKNHYFKHRIRRK